jgi:hypothetical protein
MLGEMPNQGTKLLAASEDLFFMLVILPRLAKYSKHRTCDLRGGPKFNLRERN